MREAVNATDAPGRRAGLARLAARPRRAGHHRRRHARARPPHPRRGRDARRDLPGGDGARPRRASAIARRADDGRPRPRARGDARASRGSIAGDGDGPRIVALDTGIKRSIIRNFIAARRDARAVPVHDARPTSCSPATRTGSSSCPAPATRRRSTTSSTRSARCSARKPVFGICLGHQLLSRAAGLETFKLPFGHRGANHPVKDLRTGRIAITSQNHGFAVAGEAGAAARVRPRRGRAHAREPLRRHGRGHPAARRPRRLRPVPPGGRARARTTRSACSTSSSARSTARMPRRDDLQQDPRPRLGPDRDRPGRRVRLLRRAGLQGAAGGGLRGRARELQPGDDHDRPGVRDRDLRRAAAARPGRAR